MRKLKTIKKLKRSFGQYFFVETKALSVQYFVLTEFHALKQFILEYGDAYNEELIIKQ